MEAIKTAIKIQWKFIAICIGVIAIVIIFWVAVRRYGWGWTGFGEYTGDIELPDDRPKTLWDWLGLLIVPAFLGLIALWFNQVARARETRISTDQQREEALQNYLDNIAELLLKEHLLDNKDKPDAPVVDVAQVRTVTTLRLLDANRRSILFQFLRDSKLTDYILVGASLAEVDLSHTNMYKINLSKAKLMEANLRGVNLQGANLERADLSGANLERAKLPAAKLSGAVLSGVNLEGADLRIAILKDANYNDDTKWSANFDPEGRGARKLN